MKTEMSNHLHRKVREDIEDAADSARIESQSEVGVELASMYAIQ